MTVGIIVLKNERKWVYMNQRKIGREILSVLLALVMVVSTFTGIVPGTSLKVSAETPITYLDAEGTTQTCNSYITVASESGDVTWTGGWYVVNSQVTIDGKITMSGDVHLILCDGAKLQLSNNHFIKIADNKRLNIYGQNNGSGELVINNLTEKDGSNIIGIHGGTTINGGKVDITAQGYGILANLGDEKEIVINGGDLTVNIPYKTGTLCAIKSSSTINIAGGNVTAECGNGSAISSNANINISGGKVTATAKGSAGHALTANSSVTITGGDNTLIAEGAGYGIVTSTGDITIQGENTIVFVSSGTYRGIQSTSGKIIIGHGSKVVAQGGSCAIYGDKKLYNESPGIGWTDVDGTQGEEVLPASPTSGIVYNTHFKYKKVMFPGHEHKFNYSANDANITATCIENDTDCTLTNREATLSIAAPYHTKYNDGYSADVRITDTDGIKGTATVSYYAATKNGNTYNKSGNALGSAPTNPGNYWAEITLGTGTGAATAGIGYTIAKLTAETLSENTAKQQVTIDYQKEQITNVNSGYEVSVDGNNPATLTGGYISLTSIFNNSTPKIYVRRAENSTTNAGVWVAVTLTGRPSVPTGLGSTNATNGSSADGTVTGVTSSLEYSLSGTTWTAVTSNTITGLNPGTYQVRVKATSTAPHGRAAEVVVGNNYVQLSNKPTISVSGDHNPPVIGDVLTATTTASDVIYQWYRGGEPISGATEETYTLTTEDVDNTITVKVTQTKKSDGTDYIENERPYQTSEATGTVEKKAGPSAPADTTVAGFVADYPAETFIVGDDYEVSSTYSKDGVITGHSLTEVLDGEGKIYIRAKATDDTKAGAWLEVTLPTRPSAPSGLTIVNATNEGTADGKIVGTTTGMEYSSDNGTAWNNASAENTLVVPGAYLVRVKATASAPHGQATNVTVGSNYKALTEENKPTISVSGDHNPPVIGDVLTATTTASDVICQWYRGGEPISGAMEKTYTLTTEDVDNTITVEVTQIKKSDGTDYSENERPHQTSDPTGAVEKKAGPAAPADTTVAGFVADYPAETFIINDNYEVSATNSEEGVITGNSLTEVLDGEGKIYIRAKATDDTKAGAWLEVILPTRPSEPSGLTIVNATNESTADGKIVGTTTGMEYSSDNGTTWDDASAENTLVVPGTYLVRIKATNDTPQSMATEVIIGSMEIILSDDQKPTAKNNLIYSGLEQVLINTNTEDLPDGTLEMQYAHGASATIAPSDGWSPSIPEGTEAGTYYVWYKVVGDETHTDTTPECIPVEISKAAALDVEDLEENQKPVKETDIVYTGEPITLVKKPAGTLPEGYTGVEYSIDNGKTWTTTIPDGTGAGEYTVKVKYKGDNNHEDFSGDDIKITISKAEPTITTKPAMVEGIIYTGSEQNLVKAGNTTGGELQYAIGTDSTTVPTSGWSNIIPKGKNTGTYYVWYKVVGDDNYNGIDPECVTVNIAPKEITISGISGIKKTYDGTDDATFNCSEDSVNGVKEGDDIVVTANGTYGSKDVGTGINVTINEYTISGQDKDNYTIAESGNDNETKADITVRAVNDSDDAVTSSQKENEVLSYDGDGKAPTLNVKIGDTDIDNYTVTYKGVAPTTYNSSEPPVNAGNYIAIITFNGNCAGTREVSFTIMKGEQDTPEEKLTVTNAGGDDMADGTISGLDSTKTYEYSSDGGKTWTKVEAGKTSINVAPATYQIRYAENDNAKPSEPITVFVGVSSKTTGVVNFKKDTTSSEPVETIVENAASSNIEEIAALQGEAGKDVKVELEILPKNEEKVDKTSATKISEKVHEIFDGIDIEKIVMEYLEINLEKYVDSNKTGRISDTTTPLEIELTLDKSKAGNPVVIRTHEGVAKVCERLTARPTSDFKDGTYYVGEGKLYIYSQYFSDYAIVYATEKTHYVTIDLGNGETIQKVVGDNDKIKLPTDLTREGSSFSGWYKDKDYTNTWNEEVDTINSDTVLYAKWNKLVSGVTVEVDNVKLTNAGETSQINVTVTPDDADNKKVSFVSSNPEVATVDANGVITAVANGTATITITTEDGSKTANVNVTVEISDNTTEVIRSKEAIALAMNAGYKIDQKGSKINIKWGKVKEADGYDVYVAYCGKKFGKPVKTITNNGKTSVKVSKIKGKKIKLKKNFKVYIASYKVIDGNKVVLGKTITGHVVGRKNVKYTNVKKIKLSKSKYTVKVGKTKKIKAKTVLVYKSKKQLTNAHAKEFRYATSNKKIAKVSKKGKIKGIAKGTCIIYVYARNGYAKKVKVTVE